MLESCNTIKNCALFKQSLHIGRKETIAFRLGLKPHKHHFIKVFLITPIKKTYDRLMPSENLKLNCKYEQKCCNFEIGFPFSLHFQQ